MMACALRQQWLYGLFFEPVRSLRLSVRTPGFQPGKRGSIPLGTATVDFPRHVRIVLAMPIGLTVRVVCDIGRAGHYIPIAV